MQAISFGDLPDSAIATRVLKPQPLIPDPTAPLPAVFLRAAIRHPLVYRKRVRRADGKTKAGDLVAVYHEPPDEDLRPAPPPVGTGGELLGYGLYNPRSEIAVRMLRYGPQLPDEAFWQNLLVQAVRLRRELLQIDQVSNAYRVIHAEADGLPGLVVDRFGDFLSAEVFSLGMFLRSEAIVRRLLPLCDAQHYLIRTAPHVLAHEGFESPDLASESAPQVVLITEHGTRFRIRLDQESHKTGFFCDQRENRARLASFCSGRTVLDLCCYTGGFAIQASRLGRAAEVTGVDLDEHPLKLARENANLNQAKIRFVQADVFPYMRDMIRAGRQFDVVVLDPPKLIRSRAELEEGTRKHFDLNRLAMQLVRPGGLLLSCTCAGLLSQFEFLRLLYSAARQAGPAVEDPQGAQRRTGRTLRVLAKTGAAPDHPIAANCPETEYLNAVWMTLDDPA